MVVVAKIKGKIVIIEIVAIISSYQKLGDIKYREMIEGFTH